MCGSWDVKCHGSAWVSCLVLYTGVREASRAAIQGFCGSRVCFRAMPALCLSLCELLWAVHAACFAV